MSKIIAIFEVFNGTGKRFKSRFLSGKKKEIPAAESFNAALSAAMAASKP